MLVTTGTRVSVRGLLWDVVERQPLGAQDRLRLRCASDDLSGLEWDFLHPREAVQPVRAALDPEQPAPLASWRLFHEACLLEQVPGARAIMLAQPGRLTIEPYQLVPLMRALELPRPRLLLADGVGLGKTIEAGLIAAEWIARRRAHRILIVAPAGPLLRQWAQEMRYRFGLDFTVLADAAALRDERRAMALGGNPFGNRAFILTAIDFAKQETVLEELERVSWDLVIIDEAHHCVASTATTNREATLRRRLAEVLARQTDGLLLLTATPHDGYDPHFASLIALLDPGLVDGAGGLDGLAYRRHVIRRLKSHIADTATHRPLFHDRVIIPVPIRSDDAAVGRFHRALAALVEPRISKGAGTRTFADALAFVSLLKRSVSTIAACVQTLRVVADRYAGLADQAETAAIRRDRQRTLRAYRRQALRFGVLDSQAETDMDRLEAEDIAADLHATGAVVDTLRHLIELGEAARSADPKLAALVTELRLIRATEPNANVLIYTEYADSQAEAVRVLRATSGIHGAILTIGGQDSEEARTLAAERCATEDGLILVSTDSLAEGLNLQQRCHHLIHLDLPYNPNRLEQRNGRIDRYGQALPPEIRYLCLAGTFEERLLLRLIAKYEKARAHLTFMPDTLGLTAPEDQLGRGLLMGLAEEQISLFPDKPAPLRTLDLAAGADQTEAYRDLLHEIDRAYEGFDRLAARHGWFAGQGLNAGAAQMAMATKAGQTAARDAARVDLPDFLSRATNGPLEPARCTKVHRTGSNRLFNPVIHGSGDSTSADHALTDGALAGRVHPAVRQTISMIRRVGDNRVSVTRGDQLALLLTYSIDISGPRHLALRRVIAVLLTEHGAAVTLDTPDQWLPFGDPDRTLHRPDAWRLFSTWAPARMHEAEAAAAAAMGVIDAAFIAEQQATQQAERTRLDEWLERRADRLCGPRRIIVPDLFGDTPSGPAWPHASTAAARLAGFAGDASVTGEARLEAEALVSLYRQRCQDIDPPYQSSVYPLGLLMLVPACA